MRDEDAIERWESIVPSDNEAEIPCEECGCEADFVIDGVNYCKECAEDKFQHYFGSGECTNCGTRIEDEYFTVGGDTLCPDCFNEIFRM